MKNSTVLDKRRKIRQNNNLKIGVIIFPDTLQYLVLDRGEQAKL